MKIKLNTEPVKSWFGFTRRERRSSSILLGVIFIIIAFRYVLPEQNIEIEDYGPIAPDTESLYVISDPDSSPERSAAERTRFKDPLPGKGTLSVSSRTEGSSSHFQDKPLLDINSCDSLALVALPGIGPVLSARIIKYRKLLGGFAHVGQLREVYGLSGETFELIKGKLFADTSELRRVDINSGDSWELSHIPYLEKYEVTAILKYRELAGRIRSIEDLKENKILPPEKADKAEPYMIFR